MKHWMMAGLILFAALPRIAGAQLLNGGFETPGGDGWLKGDRAGWTISFPAGDGNPGGYCLQLSPAQLAAGDETCISQAFTCGDSATCDSCFISVDYRLLLINGSNVSGKVRVFLDGTFVHISPTSANIPWTTVTTKVAGHSHTLNLCLRVSAGANQWEAGFDNVTAVCEPGVPVQPVTWGTIKAIYR